MSKLLLADSEELQFQILSLLNVLSQNGTLLDYQFNDEQIKQEVIVPLKSFKGSLRN
jgi:hypothetical protein